MKETLKDVHIFTFIPEDFIFAEYAGLYVHWRNITGNVTYFQLGELMEGMSTYNVYTYNIYTYYSIHSYADTSCRARGLN